jgi:hypothetical protein
MKLFSRRKTQPPANADPSVMELIAELQNCNPRNSKNRIAAAELLSESPPSDSDLHAYAFQTLQGVLNKSIRESKLEATGRSLKWPVIIATLAGCGVGVLIGNSPSGTELPYLVWMLQSLGVALILSFLLVVPISLIFAIPIGLDNDAKRNNPVRAACARALGQMGDPLCVGLLASMLFDRCADISTASFLALHTLLPLIRKEHYGCLPAGTSASLGRALRYKDSVLAYKILAAIEKAGTNEVVPFLEDCLRSRCHEKIKPEEVERVLAKVLEREAQLTEHSRLLRPSEVEEGNAELLLRPAANSQSMDEDQLLRAAAKDP